MSERKLTDHARTGGDIYKRWLAKGHDHGSAAEKADAWERRVADARALAWAVVTAATAGPSVAVTNTTAGLLFGLAVARAMSTMAEPSKSATTTMPATPHSPVRGARPLSFDGSLTTVACLLASPRGW